MKLSEKSFNAKEIGLRILNLRQDKSLTRDALANMADLSPKYIYEIESGKHICSAESLAKLSTALSVSSDYLLWGEQCSTSLSPILISRLLCFKHFEQSVLNDIINSIQTLTSYHERNN